MRVDDCSRAAGPRRGPPRVPWTPTARRTAAANERLSAASRTCRPSTPGRCGLEGAADCVSGTALRTGPRVISAQQRRSSPAADRPVFINAGSAAAETAGTGQRVRPDGPIVDVDATARRLSEARRISEAHRIWVAHRRELRASPA